MQRAIQTLTVILLPTLAAAGLPDHTSFGTSYIFKSSYLAQPKLAIGFFDSSATFWNSAYDSERAK